jgi:polycystin 2
VSFGMANPINYYYNQIMTGLLTGNGFSDMASMDDFWNVMSENPDDNSTAMLDSIYWETWYNGDNATADEIGSIYYENKVLGVPRLRQMRVRKNSCKVENNFKTIIANCYDSYSSSSESTDPFGIYEIDRTNMNETA